MKEYQIFTENGVYWGVGEGENFADACKRYFGTTEKAFWQVIEGEFNEKELTLGGIKLIENNPK